MVTVVSTTPHHSVVKQCICHNCGATLEYVPNDIQQRKSTDYSGHTDIDRYIKCPPCGKEIFVR